MAKRNFMIAFIVLALAQLVVRHELNLDAGRQYRFHTGAVDPADIFRGRYVTLAVRPTTARLDDPENYRPNLPLYASLKTDEEGFAAISRLTVKRPSNGDYVRVTARNSNPDNLHISWPFARYYMDEDLAPAAEDAYRRQLRAGQGDVFVTVRVRDGQATLEDLYVGGERTHDFLKHAR